MSLRKKKNQPSDRSVDVAAGEKESGVQLSRRALHSSRLAEIAADRTAGRCTPEDAAERVVQATVALYGRLLTPTGRAALEEHLRIEVANDPELRKVFS